MGTTRDALFFLCLVLIAPERELHSCMPSVCWLSPNMVKHLSDVVNLGLFNLWLVFNLCPAGLESAHGSVDSFREPGLREMGTNQSWQRPVHSHPGDVSLVLSDPPSHYFFCGVVVTVKPLGRRGPCQPVH